jgi:zinc finger protein
MDSYDDPPVEIETAVECPTCSNPLYLIVYSTEIPLEGRITIQTYTCHSCLYKNSSVQYDTDGKPHMITFSITEPNDLNVLVYRSPSAYLEIPELKAEISPGEESSGELTTVEGILLTILEKLDLMFEEKTAEYYAIKDRIESSLRSIMPITIIIRDRMGKSVVQSSKAVWEALEE